MPSSRRTFLHAAGLGVAAFGIPVAAPAQTPPPAIKVAGLAIDLYAEGYYAQELGLFKKAGLTVDLQTFSNGGTATQAVTAGACDLGVANTVSVANATLRGLSLEIIAGGGLYSSNAAATALCVAAASPLRTAKDLEGKTIALAALGDQAQAGIEAWLEKGGADSTKVKFVEVFFFEMGAALQQGRVDAAMIPEPALTIATNPGPARIFAKPFDAIAPQFLIGVWFSTTDWIKKNPDLAKRFAAAIYETARWANVHHDESAAIVARVSKIDPATVRKMTRAVYAETLTPQMIQPALDAAYKYKLTTKPVKADDLIAKLG